MATSEGTGARAKVQADLDDLRKEAGSYSRADLKDGSWFVRFLSFALKQYAEVVDAEYFQKKYPNMPADAVVDRRIDLAKKYSAIEGGLSASAYSAAVAATIGTKGGASPLTVPAAASAFTVDLLYTTRLQLHLAYDLSVLYGYPADLEDPEDLVDLIKVAFGIKAGEALRGGIAKLAPEAARQATKHWVKGTTLASLKALPVVGKYLLQRNIIKFAIPMVTIPVSAGFNAYSTGSIGTLARRTYRDKAAVASMATAIVDTAGPNALLLLKAIWMVMKADGVVSAEESWTLKALGQVLIEMDGGTEVLSQFASIVDLDLSDVLRELEGCPNDFKSDVFSAAERVCAVDHKVHKKEVEVLKALAQVCGANVDVKRLKRMAKHKV